MKLNTKYKNHLIDYVASQIKSLRENGEILEGEKIKLDKNLLEELLFEVKKDENGQKYKEIIWNAGELDKIDLSEVSFDDVNWGLSFSFDLSNANPSINFNNAYKGENGVVVSNIDFENVSLENANAGVIDYAHSCNFKGTKVKIALSQATKKKFTYCDFTGVNLRDSVLNLSQIVGGSADYSDTSCMGSVFKNTGINIQMENTKENHNTIGKMITEGKLAGCYVNEAFIPNEEQSKKMAADLLSKYQSYIESYRESIDNSIETFRVTK